ncbi:hypothetical protein Q7P35_001678 [Cladosporium inversicolor]
MATTSTSTTTSTVIIRHGLDTCPLGRLATELRQDILHRATSSITKVIIVPRALTRETPITPALRHDEPELVLITTAPISKTCTQLSEDYTTALKSQLRNCHASTIVLHVLDFDFTPFTREVFGQFSDEQRAFYNQRPRTIRIEMTITDAFALLPDERRLESWLQWRAAEESAGRGVRVYYTVRKESSTTGVNDMESVRYSMLLIDPYYDEMEGDVGKIMEAMRKWFQRVADDRLPKPPKLPKQAKKTLTKKKKRA